MSEIETLEKIGGDTLCKFHVSKVGCRRSLMTYVSVSFFQYAES